MVKAYEGLRKNAFVGGIRDHAGYEHESPAFGGGWIIMFGKDGYRNALEVKAGTKMAVR